MIDEGFLVSVPRVLDENKVQYYFLKEKRLNRTQFGKARRFLKEKRIQEVSSDEYKVLPIEGYNTRTYTIKKEDGKWKCDCQFNALKEKECSHILAVRMWRRMKGIDYW